MRLCLETHVPLVVILAACFVWNYHPISGDTLPYVMFENTILLVVILCRALCLKLPSHWWWYFAVHYVWNYHPIGGDSCRALCLKRLYFPIGGGTCSALCLKLLSHRRWYLQCVMFETTIPLVVILAVRYVWNYHPIGGDTLNVLCLKLPSYWWWYVSSNMFETTIPLVVILYRALCLKLPSHCAWWYLLCILFETTVPSH